MSFTENSIMVCMSSLALLSYKNGLEPRLLVFGISVSYKFDFYFHPWSGSSSMEALQVPQKIFCSVWVRLLVFVKSPQLCFLSFKSLT